jgi:hypothetical protein
MFAVGGVIRSASRAERGGVERVPIHFARFGVSFIPVNLADPVSPVVAAGFAGVTGFTGFRPGYTESVPDECKLRTQITSRARAAGTA